MTSTQAALAVLVLLLAGSNSAVAARLMLQTAPPPSPGSGQDRIASFRQLPMGPKLNSQFYGGYITMDASKGQKMFYVFGEAETNPKSAPIIFWMNGGPGCSSVGLNFLKGSGPFIPVSDSRMLLSNPNSFTKFANVLWLDQPLYTGWSTSKDEADRNTDDTKTAKGMLDFMLAWYERFPQFKSNKLFLAGQSYAGHYGPMLSKAILDYNAATLKANKQDSKKQAMTINLGGLAMGNAWTDPFFDNTATVLTGSEKLVGSSSSSSSSSHGSNVAGTVSTSGTAHQQPGSPVAFSSTGRSSGSSGGSSARGTAANSTTPSEALLSWLAQHNALVNVDVAYAGPSRGNVVLAKHAMTRGDVLAAIPVELCWAFEKHGAPSNNMELAAVNLLMEMSRPEDFWQPFFKTLPQPGEVVSPLVSMPAEYLPLLQSEPLERYVEAYQARVTGFWQSVVKPNEPSISLDLYKHAWSVLVTRMFGTALHGNMLVPLIHIANHVSDCTNFYTERSCPHDPSTSCMVWMAGSFIAPGSEACHSYKYMPNDKAMLQYGFLQDGPISKHLHLMDLPDFKGTNIWSLYEDSKHGPVLFDGSLQQMQQEADRLTSTLKYLVAADPKALSTSAAAGDSDGILLSLIQRWRKERQASLRLELERLQQQIKQVAALAGKTETRPEAIASNDRNAEGDARWMSQAFKSVRDCVTQHGGLVSSNITFGSEGGISTGQISQQTLDTALQQVVKPGLFTGAAVAAGEVIVAVPLQLSVPLRPWKLRMDITKLWKDIHHPRSPRAPYYTSLLSPSTGLNASRVYSAALQYLRSTGHKQMEALLLELHPKAVATAVRRVRALQELHVTTEELLRVVALVVPRLVTLPQGSFLLPVIDAAQHRVGCKNTLAIADCRDLESGAAVTSSNSSSGSNGVIDTTAWCVVLRAGVALPQLAEVCLPL